MKRFSFLVMVAVIVFMQVDSTLAWQIRHTLKVLVETSPLIMMGKVYDISSKIEKDDKAREVVYTYVIIQSEYILKGELEKTTLSIKMLGGKIGNNGGWSEQWMPFKIGEEVLLFLHPKDKANNIWELKSGSGKLPVVNNKGQRCFDCSMLGADEVSQYDSNSYFEEKAILDRIKEYMSAKKGGI